MKPIFSFLVFASIAFHTILHGITICLVPTYFNCHSEEDFLSDKKGWDGGVNPFFILKQKLEAAGHRLVVMEQIGNFKDADLVVALNYPKDIPLFKSILKTVPRHKRILFLFEPKTILIHSYNPKMHRHFEKVFTWNDDLVDNQHYFKFYYPVLHKPMLDNLIPFAQKKLCTLVATHRNCRRPGELFSHRKEAIEFFESNHLNDFDFYGIRWPENTYKSYRGRAENKHSVLSQYRFYLCYENTTNVKGYVTEKIFDCFYAGCVPIYWGASNVTDFIPEGCFIDKRDFPSLDELYDFISKMTAEEHQVYLDNIKAFLESDKSRLFSQEYFADLFLNQVIK